MFNSTFSSSSKNLVGFAEEPNGRGTYSLLSTCLFTTFICTWVIIHPRIDDRERHRVAHKCVLFLKTLVAPEFIAVEGAQERTQARRTVHRCARHAEGEFGMVQAFYFGMLGVRYWTMRGSRVLWPNQLQWLLDNRLLNWPRDFSDTLSVEALNDRSKADVATKIWALCQVGWFVVQSIARLAQKLPLAPFEAMTISYIPLFALTMFFWSAKPKDIALPTHISLPELSEQDLHNLETLSVSSIFDREEMLDNESIMTIWTLTPRVFEKEAKDHIHSERQALDGRDMAVHTPVLRRSWPLEASPLRPSEPTVLAHWDPDLYHTKLWPVACLFGLSFGALHLLSWNDVFPTPTEQWLWRAGSITSMVTMVIFMQFEKIVVNRRDPLMIVKICTPALYALSRIVIMAVAVAAFRASDPAIYQTSKFSNYWIHV